MECEEIICKNFPQCSQKLKGLQLVDIKLAGVNHGAYK